jgi:hypothetical protein
MRKLSVSVVGCQWDSKVKRVGHICFGAVSVSNESLMAEQGNFSRRNFLVLELGDPNRGGPQLRTDNRQLTLTTSFTSSERALLRR